MMNPLKALTALDGRYHKATEELQDIFSEYALIQTRVFVEIQWFKFLSAELKLFKISKEQLGRLEQIIKEFDIQAVEQIKDIERTTNHDVKAVEYYLKERITSLGLEAVREWVHFSCTSADINNTSYALMLVRGKECLLFYVNELLVRCEELAGQFKSVPMMARTHGQPATPTTVGKEFVNFAWRIKREREIFEALSCEAKFNGATGNFNAHHCAIPREDWIKASRKFLKDYLGLTPLFYTTQINPNHYISEHLHCLIRLASTLIDLDRDMWGYIAQGYFKQRLNKGEVGSSTMPHKVNPIDFENSEGNCGLAIALMQHMGTKLLNSRYQRDLTDSTVMRNLGAAFGYMILGLKSTLKGLGKIDLNSQVIARDLEDNWELLAEPIQTIMRVYGEGNPYEKLKELTRGTKVNPEDMTRFIDTLSKIPDPVKARLKDLTPANYIGLAVELVDQYFKN